MAEIKQFDSVVTIFDKIYENPSVIVPKGSTGRVIDIRTNENGDIIYIVDINGSSREFTLGEIQSM